MAEQWTDDDLRIVGNALAPLVAASVAAGTLGYVKAKDLLAKLANGSAEEKKCVGRVWPNLKKNDIIPDVIAALPGFEWKKQQSMKAVKTVKEDNWTSVILPSSGQAASNAVAPTAAAAASAPGGPDPMHVDVDSEVAPMHAAAASSAAASSAAASSGAALSAQGAVLPTGGASPNSGASSSESSDADSENERDRMARALPVAVAATSTKAKSEEPRYDVSTAPLETPPPAGALVLRDSSLAELKRRQTEVSGADAYTNRYGVAMLRGMQQNSASVGGVKTNYSIWAVANASEEVRTHLYELERELLPPQMLIEALLALPDGDHESAITRSLGVFRPRYGAEYIDKVYGDAQDKADDWPERTQGARQIVRDAEAMYANALTRLKEAERAVRVGEIDAANQPPPDAPVAAATEATGQTPTTDAELLPEASAGAMVETAAARVQKAARAVRDASARVRNARRALRDASKYVHIAKHFNEIVAADYPALSEAERAAKRTARAALVQRAIDEADARGVEWDEAKCSRFEGAVFKSTFMPPFLSDKSVTSLRATRIDDANLQQAAAKRAVIQRARAAHQASIAASVAFKAAPSDAAALATRNAAAAEHKAAMAAMASAGVAKTAMCNDLDPAASTSRHVPLRLQFPNPDPTRSDIVVSSSTHQIFTPVAVAGSDVMSAPEHLWAPAMHATITHPAAREFLHNESVFSKAGLAGMTAGAWVQAVWSQLAAPQQYEVRTVVSSSPRLINLLKLPQTMSTHPGPNRPLSNEESLRNQIAQLQAELAKTHLAATTGPSIEIVGTRTREERDAELLEQAVDVDPSPKRTKA